jgi:S-formylglutathione hydrolase FrmB
MVYLAANHKSGRYFMAIMHTLFFSNTLKRRCAMNVYVQEWPHKDGKPGFPVVYLLHGRSDDENSYADHGIRALCEKYQFIAVMPDGGRSFTWIPLPVKNTGLFSLKNYPV